MACTASLQALARGWVGGGLPSEEALGNQPSCPGLLPGLGMDPDEGQRSYLPDFGMLSQRHSCSLETSPQACLLVFKVAQHVPLRMRNSPPETTGSSVGVTDLGRSQRGSKRTLYSVARGGLLLLMPKLEKEWQEINN